VKYLAGNRNKLERTEVCFNIRGQVECRCVSVWVANTSMVHKKQKTCVPVWVENLHLFEPRDSFLLGDSPGFCLFATCDLSVCLLLFFQLLSPGLAFTLAITFHFHWPYFV